MASIIQNPVKESWVDKAKRIADEAAKKMAGQGLYGPTTLSPLSSQESAEGTARLTEYESRPSVVAQNIIKESPYTQALTLKDEGERQNAFAETLPDLVPGSIAFDLINKATKALVGGYKAATSNVLYSKPGDGKAKPLTGETTLSMPEKTSLGEDISHRLGMFARGALQGWAGDAPLTEDESVNTVLDVAVPLLAFGAVDPVKDAMLFKNVKLTGPEVKTAFSQLTSGVEQNAKPEALDYAKTLLSLDSQGKEIMSAIKTGADIKVKRDYLSWIKNIFNVSEKPAGEVSGVLGEINAVDTATAPDKVIDDLYTKSKEIYDPVHLQVGDEIKPALTSTAEAATPQMTQEEAINALIRFGSKIDENGGKWTEALKKEYEELVKIADGQKVPTAPTVKTPENKPMVYEGGESREATPFDPEYYKNNSSVPVKTPSNTPTPQIAPEGFIPETTAVAPVQVPVKPVKIPDKVFNSEKGAEVFTQLQTAAAGSRVATEEGTTALSSTFPDWVPSNLRRRAIFDDVQRHLLNGTMPKSKKASELYQIVHQRMLGGPNVPQVEAGVSKVGTSIAQKAIEDKLTKTFGGTAEYDKITIEDQAKRATDMVNNNIDKALSILHGNEPLPDGMRGAPIITALEDYAVKTQDLELLQDIARSPLTSETSVHAQEMRLLAERDPESAISAIDQVKTVRTKVLEKKLPNGQTVAKAKSNIVKDIKAEIKKVAPKKEDWASFIDSITC